MRYRGIRSVWCYRGFHGVLALLVTGLLVSCSGDGDGELLPAGPSAEPTAEEATSTSDSEAPETTQGLIWSDPDNVFMPTPIAVPDGEPNELAVVRVGSADGSDSSVPVLLRNGTDQALTGIEVTGTARDSSGSLTGSGSSQGTVPSVVASGEWAFGYVYFGTEPLPAGTTFDLSASGREYEEGELFGSVDLAVTEVERTTGEFGGEQFVGILSNPTDMQIEGPISVDAICFDDAEAVPTGTVRTFADGNSVAPGGTVSFSLDLFDQACTVFALGGSGFTS